MTGMKSSCNPQSISKESHSISAEEEKEKTSAKRHVRRRRGAPEGFLFTPRALHRMSSRCLGLWGESLQLRGELSIRIQKRAAPQEASPSRSYDRPSALIAATFVVRTLRDTRGALLRGGDPGSVKEVTGCKETEGT